MKRRERIFKTTAPPSPKKRRIQQEKGTYQEERQRTLDLTWLQVVDALKKLESFIQVYRKSKQKSPWKTEERIGVFDEIYELCTNPDANFFQKKLYDRYTEYLTDYLTNRILTEMKDYQKQESHKMSVLQRVVDVWKDYKNIFVKFCTRLLKYLDRFFVVNENLLGLQLKGHEMFRETVFKELSATLQNIILQEFGDDRSDGSAGLMNRHLVKEALTMFLDMGLDDQYQDTAIYDDLIESKLAEQTHEHFKKIASSWIDTLTMTDYLKRAEKKIEEEMSRLQSIFSEIPKTRSRLTKICQEELLVTRSDELLNIPGSSVVELIQRKDYDDLARLCNLMQMVENGLTPIGDILRNIVTKRGSEIYEKHQENCLSKNTFGDMVRYLNQNFVPEVFQLHSCYEEVVKGPFRSQVVFCKALGEGFRSFLKNSFHRSGAGNIRLKCSQLFAYYSDDIVRNTRISGDELEKCVDKIIILISFFQDRDMFMEEYRIQFSKRLLLTQYNEDVEKMILSKFKLERGSISEVYKLEKMLGDKIIASDINNKFKNFLADPTKVLRDIDDEDDEDNVTEEFSARMKDEDDDDEEEEEEEGKILTRKMKKEAEERKKMKKKKKKKKKSEDDSKIISKEMPFDLNVQILTMNIWPIQSTNEKIIPAPEFIQGQEVFTRFYRNMYNNNRVLKWCYSRSNCRVLGRFVRGERVFSVTMFQAIILLLFNSSETLSLKEIMENTGLNGSVFSVNLLSLCNRRCQILKRKKKEENDNQEATTTQQAPNQKMKKWYVQQQNKMTVNSNFWSRSSRIKVKLPRVTAKETQITQKKVESDRVMSIDACIVRVMKIRKTLRFKDLVNETINQLSSRFRPLPKNVKKRIESLMDREYLKRSESDKTVVNYLA